MFFSKNESGRTLLEMMAVFSIMAIITIGAVFGYRAIVTKAEVKNVAQEILRVVVERQHEALTKKGNEHNAQRISASHGVELEIQNLFQLKLIEIKAINDDEELINGLSKFFEDRTGAAIRPQTNQVIIKHNEGGYELYLYLRFKQFENMTGEQLLDYERSANCASGKAWDDELKECVDDLCADKTLDVCEICNSLTGEISDKRDYVPCDYDGNGEEDDGYCFNGSCLYTECTSAPNDCQICKDGDLSYKEDGTYCDMDGYAGYCEDGECKFSNCLSHTNVCQICNPMTGEKTDKPDGTRCQTDTISDGYCIAGVCEESQCTGPVEPCQSCNPLSGVITTKENGAFCQYNNGAGICDNGECKKNLCPATLGQCVKSCDPLTGNSVSQEDGIACTIKKEDKTLVAGYCLAGECKESECTEPVDQCKSCDPVSGNITNKSDGTFCKYNNSAGYCLSGECQESQCPAALGQCQISCNPANGAIKTKENGFSCRYNNGAGVCYEGDCVQDKCDGVVLSFCQPKCDSFTGEVTKKSDGTVCDYNDGDEDATDGICTGGICSENKVFKYMRLHIMACKSGNLFQLSELKLINSSGTAWTYPTSTSSSWSGGCGVCSNDEDVSKLIDNNTGTKLCGSAPSTSFNCYAAFTFPQGVDLSVYNRWQWYTANDTATYSGRNLKDYELQFSRDGENWITVDSVTNGSAPAQSTALAYTGNINI